MAFVRVELLVCRFILVAGLFLQEPPVDLFDLVVAGLDLVVVPPALYESGSFVCTIIQQIIVLF